MTQNLDPKNVNGRLYDAMAKLLDNFDEMSVREQVATIVAIARIQTIFLKLRDVEGASGTSGSAVKRYEKAFQANATRKRKSGSGQSDAATVYTLHEDDSDADELDI